MADELIRMDHISKSYGSVQALTDVTLTGGESEIAGLALAKLAEVQRQAGRDGGDPATWSAFGLIRLDRGEPIDAALKCEHALTIDPLCVDAHLVLGQTALTLGGWDEATKRFRLAEHLATLAETWPGPISVLPNAGLPELVEGQTRYPLGARERFLARPQRVVARRRVPRRPVDENVVAVASRHGCRIEQPHLGASRDHHTGASEHVFQAIQRQVINIFSDNDLREQPWARHGFLQWTGREFSNQHPFTIMLCVFVADVFFYKQFTWFPVQHFCNFFTHLF